MEVVENNVINIHQYLNMGEMEVEECTRTEACTAHGKNVHSNELHVNKNKEPKGNVMEVQVNNMVRGHKGSCFNDQWETLSVKASAPLHEHKFKITMEGHEEEVTAHTNMEDSCQSPDNGWMFGIFEEQPVGVEEIIVSELDRIGEVKTPEASKQMVELCKRVMDTGYPNRWGACIELEHRWDLNLMKSLLGDYHDLEVIEWLRFDWPISRPPNWENPVTSWGNHTSALQYPEDMNKYLKKEMDRGAVAGPFNNNPFEVFTDRVGVFP